MYFTDDTVYFSAPRDHEYCQSEQPKPEVECVSIAVDSTPPRQPLLVTKVTVAEVSVQTSLTMEDIDSLQQCKKEMENDKKLIRNLFVKEITKDDTTTNYYTGFRTNEMLVGVFKVILMVHISFHIQQIYY